MSLETSRLRFTGVTGGPLRITGASLVNGAYELATAGGADYELQTERQTTMDNILFIPGIGKQFSPIELFTPGIVGAWYDPFIITSMFQDTAGTVPITASGQTVARINDLSGNGLHAVQANSDARPLYVVGGDGRPYLQGDAVDDVLSVSISNAASQMTAACVVERVAGGPTSVSAMVFVANNGSGRFSGFRARDTGVEYASTDIGNITGTAISAGMSVGDRRMLFGQYGGSSQLFEVNGTPTGTPVNPVTYVRTITTIQICGTAGLAFSNARFYGGLIRIAAPMTTKQKTDLTNWLARRSGVTL